MNSGLSCHLFHPPPHVTAALTLSKPHTLQATCLCCLLGFFSPWTFSSSITTYRKPSLVLIPSRLRRYPFALGSHRTLSLSWTLSCCIVTLVSAPLLETWEFCESTTRVSLAFCVLCTSLSLWPPGVLTKCLLKGGLIHRAGDLGETPHARSVPSPLQPGCPHGQATANTPT